MARAPTCAGAHDARGHVSASTGRTHAHGRLGGGTLPLFSPHGVGGQDAAARRKVEYFADSACTCNACSRSHITPHHARMQERTSEQRIRERQGGSAGPARASSRVTRALPAVLCVGGARTDTLSLGPVCLQNAADLVASGARARHGSVIKKSQLIFDGPACRTIWFVFSFFLTPSLKGHGCCGRSGGRRRGVVRGRCGGIGARSRSCGPW